MVIGWQPVILDPFYGKLCKKKDLEKFTQQDETGTRTMWTLNSNLFRIKFRYQAKVMYLHKFH